MTNMYEWNADYSVGSQTLDIQHQKLSALCKKISEYQCDGSEQSIASFHSLLNDLVFYSQKHFQTEEDALRFNGYTKLDEHKKEHETYKNQIVGFVTAAVNGQIDQATLQSFLGKWWSNHILGSDIQYRDCVTRKWE